MSYAPDLCFVAEHNRLLTFPTVSGKSVGFNALENTAGNREWRTVPETRLEMTQPAPQTALVSASQRAEVDRG